MSSAFLSRYDEQRRSWTSGALTKISDLFDQVTGERKSVFLGELTRQQRATFLLRIQSGMTLEEVAPMLGVSIARARELQIQTLRKMQYFCRRIDNDDPTTQPMVFHFFKEHKFSSAARKILVEHNILTNEQLADDGIEEKLFRTKKALADKQAYNEILLARANAQNKPQNC